MKKILFVHGIGGNEATIEQWKADWINSVSGSAGIPADQIESEFLLFDELFEKRRALVGKIEYARALKELLSSWILSALEPEAKSFGDVKESIRWTAGMVAQFTTDSILRKQLNQRFSEAIDRFKPDVVVAHSLGTLLAYDLLKQEATSGKKRNFYLVTAASQIGHPSLRRLFGGTIGALNVPLWVNFNNPYDRIFAYESLKIDSPNFREIKTPFNQGAFKINHDAVAYFTHENAVNRGWPLVFGIPVAGKGLGAKNQQIKLARQVKAEKTSTVPTTQKALLVGINDYPNPENQLNGCVNDVYRMSEVLQEMGLDPANIKVVINERADSKNLRRMMDWLLSDAREGDTRFFFYSGHGAQIPSAEMDEESDHTDECLVTYDFDWTRENAYTDKEFAEAYSQLSYGVNFSVMLDCCHSGGMSRDGVFKARGISPPDDIKHRMIKWDPKREMWIPRKMALSKQNLFSGKKEQRALFTGEDGNTQRFGRGVSLWSDVKSFEKAKQKYGTHGAYMPMIIEACAEKESAYEYKHGPISFGAFTFALSTVLRQYNRSLIADPKHTPILVYKDLVSMVSKELKKLGYRQSPQIVGPSIKINSKVPGLNVA